MFCFIPQKRFYNIVFEESNLPIYYLDFEKDDKFPSQKLCRYKTVLRAILI